MIGVNGLHTNLRKVIKTAVTESEFCLLKLADRCENYVLAAI